MSVRLYFKLFVQPPADPTIHSHTYPNLICLCELTIHNFNCKNVYYDQQDATIWVYLFIPSQLYHQEHVIVFTASGNVHRCCCRLVSWM